MKFTGVAKHFGRRVVLHDVSFQLAPGERLAITGDNGAGKTTLLRLAAGLLRPTAGRIEAPPTAYVPQDAPIYPELTPAEHLRWWARLHDVPVPDAPLGAALHRPAAALSRGQRQRLHLAMAFGTKRFLLLDEPATALDAAGQAWLEDLVAAHHGGALVATHGALAGIDRSMHLHEGGL